MLDHEMIKKLRSLFSSGIKESSIELAHLCGPTQWFSMMCLITPWLWAIRLRLMGGYAAAPSASILMGRSDMRCLRRKLCKEGKDGQGGHVVKAWAYQVSI